VSLSQSLESLKNFDFNDLDVNNAGIWPAPLKAIVLLIVFGLVLGGGYWFLIKDQYLRLEQVDRKEVELREQYKIKAYRVANLDVYKHQMAEMEETFGALVRQLPSDTEVPGLLEDITNTALGSGLELQQIQLQSEIQRDFYVELPINISVTGEYHELGSFVSSVAGLPRIVTLHDFEIAPVKSEGTGPDQLSMKVVAKTYRYKSGGGQ
jgi:type IV pilus assembly protein PilO